MPGTRAPTVSHCATAYDSGHVKAPEGPSETSRVLRKSEVARFGEYRTARLVLAAYDQLTKHPLAAE